MCTQDSLRELAAPGLLAAFAPIAVGFGLGVGPLAGFLAGAITTGVLMAVFLTNSGGAWDNAKKLVEDGHYGGKNTDRKSTRLNSSHVAISYAVFCLKKKTNRKRHEKMHKIRLS